MEQNITKNNKYEHGKIYQLIDNTTGMFYIGSTALSRLDHRLRNHISHSNYDKHKNTKLYKYFTFDKLKSGDVKIILLEEVNVNNKRELEKIENEYIQRELKNVLCLNTRSAIKNMETCIKWYKKHYQNMSKNELFKEKEHQNRIVRYEKTKEQSKEYSRNFYYENKDRLIEYYKEYRATHKDLISKWKKERITCECGCELRKDGISEHRKSQGHLKWLTGSKQAIEKYKCECGSEYLESNKARHLKSQHHLKWLNNDQEIIKEYKCECGGKYSGKHKNRHFKTKKHQQYMQQQESTAV